MTARTELLSNVDGDVFVVIGPADSAATTSEVLVFESFGHDLDFAYRLVGILAIGLGAIVTTIIASGAAPKMLYVLPSAWLVIAFFAFRRARDHRRRYGRFELDVARGELRHRWHEHPIRTHSIAEIVRVHVETIARGARDEESQRGARVEQVALRWMELELTSGACLRLARALPWELSRVRAKLHDLGIAVA